MGRGWGLGVCVSGSWVCFVRVEVRQHLRCPLRTGHGSGASVGVDRNPEHLVSTSSPAPRILVDRKYGLRPCTPLDGALDMDKKAMSKTQTHACSPSPRLSAHPAFDSNSSDRQRAWWPTLSQLSWVIDKGPRHSCGPLKLLV